MPAMPQPSAKVSGRPSAGVDADRARHLAVLHRRAHLQAPARPEEQERDEPGDDEVRPMTNRPLIGMSMCSVDV